MQKHLENLERNLKVPAKWRDSGVSVLFSTSRQQVSPSHPFQHSGCQASFKLASDSWMPEFLHPFLAYACIISKNKRLFFKDIDYYSYAVSSTAKLVKTIHHCRVGNSILLFIRVAKGYQRICGPANGETSLF